MNKHWGLCRTGGARLTVHNLHFIHTNHPLMFSPVWLTRWTVCYLSHFYHVWTSLKYSPGLSHPPFKCLYLKWNPATPLRSLRHLLWNSLCISQHRALSLNVGRVSSWAAPISPLCNGFTFTSQWGMNPDIYMGVRLDIYMGCETWVLTQGTKNTQPTSCWRQRVVPITRPNVTVTRWTLCEGWFWKMNHFKSNGAME